MTVEDIPLLYFYYYFWSANVCGMSQYYCGLTNLGEQMKTKSLVEKMNENPGITSLVLQNASD